MKATLDSRKAYIKNCNPEKRSGLSRIFPRIARTDIKRPCLIKILESKLGSGFFWLGWGPLYRPYESENVNNPFFLFETALVPGCVFLMLIF